MASDASGDNGGVRSPAQDHSSDPVTGPASITLPMSGIVKCAKEGLNNMHMTSEAKQALHDAALVFISFVSSV